MEYERRSCLIETSKSPFLLLLLLLLLLFLFLVPLLPFPFPRSSSSLLSAVVAALSSFGKREKGDSWRFGRRERGEGGEVCSG